MECVARIGAAETSQGKPCFEERGVCMNEWLLDSTAMFTLGRRICNDGRLGMPLGCIRWMRQFWLRLQYHVTLAAVRCEALKTHGALQWLWDTLFS